MQVKIRIVLQLPRRSHEGEMNKFAYLFSEIAWGTLFADYALALSILSAQAKISHRHTNCSSTTAETSELLMNFRRSRGPIDVFCLTVVRKKL